MDQIATEGVQESLRQIPVACNFGTKKNFQGHVDTWKGYKLLADVNGCGMFKFFNYSLIIAIKSLYENGMKKKESAPKNNAATCKVGRAEVIIILQAGKSFLIVLIIPTS